ncbi:hypothetical protein [uncultured Tyzzerella sp.]|uniref:hypothetical protein n=1 Tax=uncultured Tyzzerella sp. TaxID=2321398 RepID=UPI00294226F0|nr:hypothetical protein [uncultured Tyzzerella sp.]
MDNDKRIDDIIAMLDKFITKDGGHMNIEVNGNDINSKKVDIANSSDCCSGNMACRVPTLFEGVEEDK